MLTYLGLKHHQDNLTDLVLNLILSSLAFHIYIIWTWNIFHFNNLMSALCDCYDVIKSKLLDLNWSYLQKRAVTEILKQGGFYWVLDLIKIICVFRYEIFIQPHHF